MPPDVRPESRPSARWPLDTRVETVDGPGVTVGVARRRNTNQGPGTRQYAVRLDDGRVRHYGLHDVRRAGL